MLQFLPHTVNWVRFCFWHCLWLFCLCIKYILGTTEQICAEFTWKTCLVPHSDRFEGQRSRSPRTKSGIFHPFRRPACGLCLLKHL